MSYNISHIEIVNSKDFSISKARYLELRMEFEDERDGDRPESNIFDKGWLKHACEERDERLYPKRIWWGSDGSGSLEHVLREVLAEFDGEADLVLTWEGGDSISGLKLRDHKVTEAEVSMGLK